VEAFVEPEEVGVSAEDGGVACVLEYVVWVGIVGVVVLLGWWADVYTVGCVFVHSF